MHVYLFNQLQSNAGGLTTASRSANIMSRDTDREASISFPPSLFQLFPNDTFTLLFTMFSSSVLLPQSQESSINKNIRVASSVISASFTNREIANLTNDRISITLRLEDPVSVIHHSHSLNNI